MSEAVGLGEASGYIRDASNAEHANHYDDEQLIIAQASVQKHVNHWNRLHRQYQPCELDV